MDAADHIGAAVAEDAVGPGATPLRLVEVRSEHIDRMPMPAVKPQLFLPMALMKGARDVANVPFGSTRTRRRLEEWGKA